MSLVRPLRPVGSELTWSAMQFWTVTDQEFTPNGSLPATERCRRPDRCSPGEVRSSPWVWCRPNRWGDLKGCISITYLQWDVRLDQTRPFGVVVKPAGPEPEHGVSV